MKRWEIQREEKGRKGMNGEEGRVNWSLHSLLSCLHLPVLTLHPLSLSSIHIPNCKTHLEKDKARPDGETVG